MSVTKNILIVKYGALGDVVRTSFFAKPLHMLALEKGESVRLYWLTSPGSLALLRFQPFIDVVTTNASDLREIEFDAIYSLDDEIEVLSQIADLRSKTIIGATLDNGGCIRYCKQSSYWFDMGLLSKFGKEYADAAKRENQQSHSDIFKTVFDVSEVDFTFYNSDVLHTKIHKSLQKLANGKVPIGLNAFAGQRWPSKALPDSEFPRLVQELSQLKIHGQGVHVFLVGSGADRLKNQNVLTLLGSPKNVTALNTDSNVLELAAAIRFFKLLVTADSLCVHLATGQQVPTVAFFSATSAAEIENLCFLRKIASLSEDYCNYKPDADNSTITCDRIMHQISGLIETNANA